MKRIPNERDGIKRERNYVKNDLYRKFKKPFDKILNKDFDEGGIYGKKAYVSVAPDVEEAIREKLDSFIDVVTPLTGYTGIGKTHLMMSALCDYYEKDNILPNNPIIIDKAGKADILLYCAHERYNRAILDDIESLLYSRIESLCQVITQKWEEVSVNFDEVQMYIEETKREINFYYSDRAKEYATVATEFKLLLKKNHNKIHNVVIVYDDLESLDGEQQFTLIRDFLAIFECFRNSRPKNINFKFFFCMRTTTYCNLVHHPGFDTHRTGTAIILDRYPSMKQLFEKRFDIIVDEYKIYEQTQKKTEWDDAKEVLMQLADRIELCSKDLLYELSNYNVSNALDKFANILSNRFWTQKNKNPTASFKIKGYEYYINNANIFKVLMMGEGNIFWSNDLEHEANIFFRAGHLLDDLLCLYVLKYFYKRYVRSKDIKIYDKESCTFVQLQGDLLSLFGDGSEDHIKRVKLELKKIFEYYKYNDLIREEDIPSISIENNLEKRYHLTPKGYTVFKNFMASSILFEIYRDEFAFDENRYDIRCSFELSQEQIFLSYFTYISDFWEYESSYIQNINEDNLKREDYSDYFGEMTLSLEMISGLKTSMEQYYKEEKERESLKLYERVIELRNKIQKEGNFESSY